MDGVHHRSDHVQDGFCTSLYSPCTDGTDSFLVGLAGRDVVNEGGVNLINEQCISLSAGLMRHVKGATYLLRCGQRKTGWLGQEQSDVC